ncbi:MAG TPA: helix-turn-helix transcriptional regulator [Acidiphilium sp.]
MRHDDLWRAIDTLAAERGLSTSGLARSAGLDPTSFNPSKRRTGDGKLRWPSTESIAKILAATGASFEAFAALVRGSRSLAATRLNRRKTDTIPLIGLAQAGQDGFFDDAGYPVGAGWEQIGTPHANTGLADDPLAYGLTIHGDSMEPVYRAGDVIIVSPSARIRTGDRVVARTSAGEVMAKSLARRSTKRIDLASFNPKHPARSFAPDEIVTLHRIVWASQ